MSVSCLSFDEILSGNIPSEFATAGIHPWWLEDYTGDEIKKVQDSILTLVQNKKIWGIGETGIDRAYPEFLEEQKKLFDWHLELSEKYKLPLIIHSVRAGADFLQILKEKKPASPWVFHDFRGNETLMKDLLRLHPDCYFSFGLSIDNSPQVRELLPHIPVERLFLETDDQKHLDIHDIHLRAAHHLTLDVEFLKSQIWYNFRRLSQT